MMKIKVLNSQTLVETQEVDLEEITRIGNECTVGRSPHSGLVLDSPDVSRLHGKLIVEDGAYYFSDLGSKNGSVVNGKVALTNQRYKLKSGDIIRLGEFVLTVEEIRIVLEEELPQTVIGGIDATVISGWQVTPLQPFALAEPTPAQEVNLVEIAKPVPAQASEPGVVVEHQLDSRSSIQEPNSIADSEVAQVTSVSSIKNTEAVSIDVIDIPAPTPVEIATSGISSDPEQVDSSEDTYIQAPEPVVIDLRQPEVKSEVDEIAAIEQSEDTYIQAPELAAIAVPEAHEEQRTAEEILVQFPNAMTPPEVVEVPVKDEDGARRSEIPEELDVTQMQVVESSEMLEVITPAPGTFEMTDIDILDRICAPVTDPEAIATTTPALETEPELPEIATSTPDAETVPAEATAQTSDNKRETISEKYIALMAHDTKKSELVQLVAQHQEFFSKCRTIATPSVSDVLSHETGVIISQKTPTVPVGGFQTIASLVGGGEILAVIFLRDFLATQTEQANEEALIRLCNVNQVLLATNISTAEAIVHYVKDLVLV